MDLYLELFFICYFDTICFIYVKILKYIKSEYLPKYTWLTFILPIITIILLVTMGDYFNLLRTNPKILITTVGLAISNIIFFFIFMLAIHSTNMRHKLQIAEQREELINSKLNLLSQHYNYNFQFYTIYFILVIN